MGLNELTYREKVIYLAGLLEGEGCFKVSSTYTKKSGEVSRYVRVTIGMTDKDVIQWCADNFPSRHKILTLKNGSDEWKPLYVLSWGSHEGKDLMLTVLPYMGERRSAKIRDLLELDIAA